MRLRRLGVLVDDVGPTWATIVLVVPALQTVEIGGMTTRLVGIETVAQITVSQN